MVKDNFFKRFRHTFHITIWELIIALGAIITFFILKAVTEEVNIFLIVYGLLVGTWLAFRPSEWAVEGLNSGSKYVGLSEYVAGILSSLASNLPEAIVAILLILKGKELIAVVTVLSAAGFNTIILGISIIVATWRTWDIKVPKDLEKKEAPVIRWTIVAMSMTVVFALIEYIHELSISGGSIADAQLTKPVAGLLLTSYIAYLVYIIAKKEDRKELPLAAPGDEVENTKKDNKKEETTTKGELKVEQKNDEDKIKDINAEDDGRLSVLMTITFLVLGFVGIYFGGETLTWSAEELLHNPSFSTNISDIMVALILGAVGAVPEHGIAIVSAIKHQVDVAFGNAIGGIVQSSLLIFGLIGVIVSVTLHPFIVLQLAAIAGVLWFVKRSIQDGKFDMFEGFMILLLQTLIFVILFEDIAIFE